MKSCDLDYKAKSGKNNFQNVFSKYLLPIVFQEIYSKQICH